jgi:hypothetical protein
LPFCRFFFKTVFLKRSIRNCYMTIYSATITVTSIEQKKNLKWGQRANPWPAGE